MTRVLVVDPGVNFSVSDVYRGLVKGLRANGVTVAEFSMTDAVFPGNDATLESSALRCLEQFTPFVGSDFLESDLDLFPITPTAQSWDEGDRVVYCALYAVDLSKLTGSMRGSGR